MKLGDIIDIKHGFAFSGDHIIEEDNGVVLVTPGNFRIGGGFQEKKCKFFDGEIPQDYILNEGDFIVTMTDLSKTIDTLGYSALVPKSSSRMYLHNQRIGLVQFKNDSCDRGYIYWLMRTRGYQRTIANTSTGSTVHHTSPTKICDFEFNPPSHDVQRRIAEVLSRYDALIENYQRQIKLLEEAAQRLYKEWFVDLRFPGHQSTPIINNLPQSWQKKSVSMLGEYLNGFAFKPSDWQETGKPIIKIKEMGNGVTAETPRNNGDRVPEKYLIKAGDLLFSWSATLMVIVWTGEEGWLNQHLFKVTPAEGIGREFLLQSIANAIAEFSNLTTGSTMKHIQRNKLDQVFVNTPPPEIMEKYNNLAESIRTQIINKSVQIRNLSEARDRLLPKLMSGEA